MPLKNTPIQRKLMFIILMTSVVVMLLMRGAFFTYEFLTFRQATVRQLSTLGAIIADNSTAALAFQNQDDAIEILAALRAERHIVAAALYDQEGKLFAKYPADLPDDALPVAPGKDGYEFQSSHLTCFEPVIQSGKRRLGTVYLRFETRAILYEWLWASVSIALAVMAVVLLVAYLLSKVLQKQISQPILALAETARAVSERRDYSVRAQKLGSDEVGLLTDAFNHMLTQIHEQNRALRASEHRFRALIEHSTDGISVIDKDNEILYLSPAVAAIEGYTPVELIGRNGIENTHAEDLPLVQQTVQHLLEYPGKSVPVLWRRKHKNGEWIWLEGVATNLIDDPAVGGIVTNYRDVTERKEAETRVQTQLNRLDLLHRITRAIGERQDLASIFQVIIRSLEDKLPIDFGSVCLYDADTEILTVSSVGVRSGSLAIELAMNEQARIPIDQNGLSRCVRGELVYEPDIRQVPFPFPQRLAQAGLGCVVIAPLLVESKVFGVLVAARRQTQGFSSADCEFLRQLSEQVALAAHQAQLYSSLQKAYDELRQTQNTVLQQERLRALGQMASGIAHDINNAISPVSLYTESLLEREPNLSERARDYLRTIQRAIEDVAETVAGMREFYRQREPQLVLAPIELNLMVQHVIDLTRARWSDLPQERGIVIKLNTELTADLPSVMGAQSEIRDSLTNLVFNAVDAMPDGGTLTLRTRVLSSQDSESEKESIRQVRLDVCDTGVGMTEETRRRCLEPFFSTKGERGTGLGLAMVYGMVERHSAHIEIESELGKGTTIQLIFPVATPVLGSSALPSALASPLRPLHILIVDDDPIIIKSLTDILQADGHFVIAKDSGQAGIDAFVSAQQSVEAFDAVITDLGMPYVDGRKVAAAVKAASPTTPIILLTGWGQRLIAEHDIPSHVDRVLSKPPKLQELRAALAELTSVEPAILS